MPRPAPGSPAAASYDGARDAALLAVLAELTTAPDLETLVALSTHAVRDVVGADGATFVVREGADCHYLAEDAIGPLWQGRRFPVAQCVTGRAMVEERCVAVEDVYADAAVPAELYRPTFVHGMAVVPLGSQGAVGAYWSRPHALTPDDRRRLEAIARTAALVWDNLSLRAALTREQQERDAVVRRNDRLLDGVRHLAHDLRNPLASMMGYAELMAAGEDDPDTVAEFSTGIVAAGRRLADRIDTALEL